MQKILLPLFLLGTSLIAMNTQEDTNKKVTIYCAFHHIDITNDPNKVLLGTSAEDLKREYYICSECHEKHKDNLDNMIRQCIPVKQHLPGRGRVAFPIIKPTQLTFKRALDGSIIGTIKKNEPTHTNNAILYDKDGNPLHTFYCKQCEKDVTEMLDLDFHLENTHNICPECQQNFPSSREVRNHRMFQHTRPEMLKAHGIPDITNEPEAKNLKRKREQRNTAIEILKQQNKDNN